MSALAAQFGPIDIYLFDQILRGRIAPGMRIFDAGCGSGRNLVYFLRQGYDVYGVDADPRAIATLSAEPLAGRHCASGAAACSEESAARSSPATGDRFRAEPVEASTFPDCFADVVLSSAVLHFARDDDHFRAMLLGSWRVLKSGGLFFCRLASTIGMEHRMQRVAGRHFRLPDGSERYLVDEPLLLSLTQELGGRPLDPLKTTVVQDQRCMTTWVLRKM